LRKQNSVRTHQRPERYPLFAPGFFIFTKEWEVLVDADEREEQ
jgi:hypothetical protein